MARFLVTGGAGFIGSNTVEELLSEGHEIRVLDNFVTGKKENLSQFVREIEVIEGDIRDLDIVKKAAQGMEYVVHLAALGSVPRSVEDPLTTNEVNVAGTLNVLMAAKDVGVTRVVYSSSSSVYGDDPTLPKREDMLPRPLSPYAVSKLAGEYYCRIFYQVYGLETVSLRYFNIYGKRQDPYSQYAAVVTKFIKAFFNGENPVIFGDGEQSRDFTFIEDCVQANIKACFAIGVEGKAFNISYGARVTVNELSRKIRGLLGKDGIEPTYISPRLGDVKHSMADNSRAQDLLGFKPICNIDLGLKKAVEWYTYTHKESFDRTI